MYCTKCNRIRQEIQKIVVFEGAFEKIFSIINEEGGSDGGVVVQVMMHSESFPIMITF